MNDLKLLIDQFEESKKNLGQRNFDLSLLTKLIEVNDKRKILVKKVDDARSAINNLSKEIGAKKAKKEDAQDLMNQVAITKEQMSDSEIQLAEIEIEFLDLQQNIPNILDASVPPGKTEDLNVEVRKWGVPKTFSFQVKDHVDLGENLGFLDFNAAANMTASRFSLLKGPLAQLERALSYFMINYHIHRGYTEVATPYLVHEKSLVGTGQLPKFKEDLFKIEGRDWYLIPTSEVSLTNMVREQILNPKDLPMKFVAYTPCFRSEAGSYGKDTRGLIRMHQFNKVEMVQITSEEGSEKAHEDMINSATGILEALQLPYRVLQLCAGDVGFGSRKTIDLEVWLPAQNKYREISSISNCWDFQARRASIRYKNAEGKMKFAHTLNGSGLAVGRTLVAVLENYQRENGSIEIPEVLVPLMGGLKVIEKL